MGEFGKFVEESGVGSVDDSHVGFVVNFGFEGIKLLSAKDGRAMGPDGKIDGYEFHDA